MQKKKWLAGLGGGGSLGGGSRGWVGDGVGGCEPRVEGIVKRA